MKNNRRILSIIVFAQFACTSLWFAGNAVVENLAAAFQLNQDAIAHITSAVQFGFISGTLFYAVLTLSDRFPPSRVFFGSALIAAASNLAICFSAGGLYALLGWRFITGFFLAGIYPVGMKIASDYYKSGLGKALGFLVGALVVGTAFPHLLKSAGGSIPWKNVLYLTSGLAILGGLSILLLVPTGPFHTKSQQFDAGALFKVFKNRSFRAAAFGYFGHMWELYTFWAFVPFLLEAYTRMHGLTETGTSLWAFFIIAIGGLSCVSGGYLSQKFGSSRTAFGALTASAICCLLAPFAFHLPEPLFRCFLLFWGMVVIADSPLFSSLVAQNAVPEYKGTGLTIVTCIGFAITIISIQLVNFLWSQYETMYVFSVLALGPVIGLWTMWKGKMQV